MRSLRALVTCWNNFIRRKSNPPDQVKRRSHRRRSPLMEHLETRWALSASDVAELLSPPQTLFSDLVDVKVVGRYAFYNNSKFDGKNPAANVADDAAIAPDKSALLPGETATSANYTSYSRGINGVMIDLAGLPLNPTADDFRFLVGNDSTLGSWADAPDPLSISVRRDAGTGGADRVTIIWADGAIKNQWLQVTVRATPTTGLASDDVFYFGNAVGETGNSASNAIVNSADELATQRNPRSFKNPASIQYQYDFNRDGFVDAIDQLLARQNSTTSETALKLIQPAIPAATTQYLEEQPQLFYRGDATSFTYYAPVMVKTADGSILAVAERRTTTTDTSVNGFGMRRSTDNGITWSPIQVIFQDDDNSLNVGSFVADETTGKVFFLFSKNISEIFVISSDDDGLTWSDAVNITSSIKVTQGNNPAPGQFPNDAWGWYAIGPGHGIQLQHGAHAGRLIVAADHRLSADVSGPSWSHVIYSDDHGATWKLGGGVDQTNPVNNFTNEASVVELSDGRLYMNMRNVAHNLRFETFSTDGGITWSNAQANSQIVVPSVSGTVLRLNANTLLFAAPSTTDSKRNKMTVWASFDEAQTWTLQKSVSWDFAAYSDMVVAGDDTVLLAYNAGYTFTSESTSYMSFISMARFNMRWLQNPAPAQFTWDFNEMAPGQAAVVSGSTILDSSKADLRISPQGGPPVYVAGQNGGSALQLTSSFDNVLMTSKSLQALWMPSNSFTVETTIRTSSTSGVIIGSDPTLAGWTLQIVDGKVQFIMSDKTITSAGNIGNTSTITSDQTVNDGQWHRIVAVRDFVQHKLSLYIDGQSAATIVDDATLTPSSFGATNFFPAVTLGSLNLGQNQLAFDIDTLRITRDVVPQSKWLRSDYVGKLPLPAPAAPTNPLANMDGLALWVTPPDPQRYYSDTGFSLPLPLDTVPGTGIHSGYDSSPNHFSLSTDTYTGLQFDQDPVMGPVWKHDALSYTIGAGLVVRNSSGFSTGNFDFVQNTGVFTLSTFVKVGTGFGAQQALFNNIGNSALAAGMNLWVEADGRITLNISDGTRNTEGNANPQRIVATAPPSISNDTWFHVAVVGEGPGKPVTFYITPVSQETVTAYVSDQQIGGANGTYTSFQNLQLGNIIGNGTTAALKGSTAQEMIFNRALTPTEIQQLFNYGKSWASA